MKQRERRNEEKYRKKVETEINFQKRREREFGNINIQSHQTEGKSGFESPQSLWVRNSLSRNLDGGKLATLVLGCC